MLGANFEQTNLKSHENGKQGNTENLKSHEKGKQGNTEERGRKGS